MNDAPTRRQFVVGGGLAVLSGLAGCTATAREVEEQISETIDPDGASELTVAGNVGDVSVVGEDRDAIRVDGSKRAADEDDFDRVSLEVERDGETVAVRVDRDEADGLLSGPDPLLELDVAVPETLRVARVKTDTGAIEATAVRGPLAVETDTGAIEVTAVDGRVTATSDTGEVSVTDAAGIGDLTTDTGDVSADVRGLEGDAAVETSTGDVSLTLARSLDAAVDAETSTGEITVRGFPDVDDRTAESPFDTTLGNGTAALSVSSSTGDVLLSVED